MIDMRVELSLTSGCSSHTMWKYGMVESDGGKIEEGRIDASGNIIREGRTICLHITVLSAMLMSALWFGENQEFK